MSFIKVPAIKVNQNDNSFYIFNIKAGDLLEIAFFSPRTEDRTGIQRPFSRKRSKDIAKFLQEEDSVLPNSLIINLRLNDLGINELSFENGILYIPKKKDLAFIIDGQHRLKAFQECDMPHFPLVVSAFENLSLAKAAEIFVSINFNQKQVNNSIVFDLLGISENIFPKYYKYHKITDKFNSYIKSPWYKNIKMLGVGKGIITQATFIKAMEENKILDEKLKKISEQKQFAILFNYFEALKQTYPHYWCNKKYILCKSVGFYAQMYLFPHVLNHVVKKTHAFRLNDIIECLKPLKKLNFELDEIRDLGGKAGAHRLHLKMLDALKWR